MFILGPSHQVPFRGIAVYDEGAWNTPLGSVEVDRDAANRFMELSGQPGARELHRVEHSIEVQIPFLQTVLESVKIVPLMLGPFEACSLLVYASGYRERPRRHALRTWAPQAPKTA